MILQILLILTILVQTVSAQEKDSSTLLSVTEASLIPVTIATAIIVLNYEAFWKRAVDVPFWVSNDPPYAMHIDKFAHGYLCAVGSAGIKAGYELAGVSEKTSSWLGAGISFGLGLMIEFEDARHGEDPQYGFSPGDAAGDLIGARGHDDRERRPPVEPGVVLEDHRVLGLPEDVRVAADRDELADELAQTAATARLMSA